MAVPIERMEYAARSFANLWVDSTIEPAGALDQVRQLYRDDAVFISPNPPRISSEFETILHGRDQIMKYHDVCMKRFPAGSARTIAIMFGIDMAIWVYEAKLTNAVMADVLLFDEHGMIETQRVTSAGLQPGEPPGLRHG